jgi:hypothetical protein
MVPVGIIGHDIGLDCCMGQGNDKAIRLAVSVAFFHDA